MEWIWIWIWTQNKGPRSGLVLRHLMSKIRATMVAKKPNPAVEIAIHARTGFKVSRKGGGAV
jgi:hypothetical protein